MDTSRSMTVYNNSPKSLGTILEEAEQPADHGFPSVVEGECPFMLGSDLSPVSSPVSHLALSSGHGDHQPSPTPSCSSSTLAYADLPALPMSPEQGNVEDYLCDYDVLREADGCKNRKKRVRFDDFGLSLQEEAAMISRLEDVAYQKNLEDDTMSDGDIITLQVFTINGLQQARQRDGQRFSRLTEALEALKEENRVLQEMNRDHVERRLHILNNVVRRRGQGLMEHGEFLMRLAEQNSAPSQ